MQCSSVTYPHSFTPSPLQTAHIMRRLASSLCSCMEGGERGGQLSGPWAKYNVFPYYTQVQFMQYKVSPRVSMIIAMHCSTLTCPPPPPPPQRQILLAIGLVYSVFTCDHTSMTTAEASGGVHALSQTAT